MLLGLVFYINTLNNKNETKFLEVPNNDISKVSENQIVYFASDTCEACRQFKPILDEVVNERKVEILYWNSKNVEVYKKAHDIGVNGTPTLILKRGQTYLRYEGLKTKKEVIEILDENMM